MHTVNTTWLFTSEELRNIKEDINAKHQKDTASSKYGETDFRAPGMEYLQHACKIGEMLSFFRRRTSAAQVLDNPNLNFRLNGRQFIPYTKV